MAEWLRLEEGIRARLHPERRHGVKPDQYFVLRYVVDGQRKQEALGWASEGWTLAKARAELAKLKEAARTGVGAVTLQEKRAKARATREVEQAKPTIARLWEKYLEHKGQYPNRYIDGVRYKHLSPLCNRLADSLKTTDVDAIAKEMLQQGKAPATIHTAIALLRRLINFAVKKDMIDHPARLHFHMPKVDLFTLQKLFTHGSPQMTQRYAHFADEAVKRAASVIDECLDVAANAAPPAPRGPRWWLS